MSALWHSRKEMTDANKWHTRVDKKDREKEGKKEIRSGVGREFKQAL